MTSGVFWVPDVKGALGHLREVSAPRRGAGGYSPLAHAQAHPETAALAPPGDFKPESLPRAGGWGQPPWETLHSPAEF